LGSQLNRVSGIVGEDDFKLAAKTKQQFYFQGGTIVRIVPVILSGGSGSRLWPVSRLDRPKQFIPGLVANENNLSLFQQTVKRLSGLGNQATKPIVVCNTEHRFLVTEQLKQINAEATVLLEPVGRNTAPAITLAALLATEAYGPNTALFVAPSDHQINDTEAFLAAARTGIETIAAAKLVTFGVVPHYAETGFGYIHATLNGEPAADVNQFVEKPDLATAEKYVQSGEYFWNSGMFLLPTRLLLSELRAHAPAILKACDKALSHCDKTSEFLILDKTEFELCPSDSIDYAVMEKTSLAMMVPLDAGWSDAGSYAALLDLGERDSDGNVLSGDVVTQDCKNSYIQSHSRLVTAVGLDGVTVIETADAVLVAPVHMTDEVKSMVAELAASHRQQVHTSRKVYRPWGSFDVLETGNGYLVKILEVNSGGILSLQSHNHRAETWTIVEGNALVTLDDLVFKKSIGESVHVPVEARHRIENSGDTTLKIVEVQIGDLLEEEDIVRYADNYGRIETNAA